MNRQRQIKVHDHLTSATAPPLRDVQKSRDTRKIAIGKVGVKDISYPIVVMDKNRSFQHTVARVNMYVDLPHHFKGTHMSRFIEILNTYREKIALDKMETDPPEDEGKARRFQRPPGDRVPLFHREEGAGLGRQEPHGVHLRVHARPWPRSSISCWASRCRSPRSALAARSSLQYGAHNQRSRHDGAGPLPGVHLDRGPDRDDREVRQFARSIRC